MKYLKMTLIHPLFFMLVLMSVVRMEGRILATCGNGIIEAGEQCDSGSVQLDGCNACVEIAGATCSTSNTEPFSISNPATTMCCGDHRVHDQEECDAATAGCTNC